jgi:hypothetical protein
MLLIGLPQAARRIGGDAMSFLARVLRRSVLSGPFARIARAGHLDVGAAMKDRLLLSAILALSPCLSVAADFTVTSNNSTLKVTTDTVPGFHLPRVMEWTVDGRKILVYPSGPWSFIDVQHFHPDAHVLVQQIHAQGPMIGYAGTVTGGAVYTVDGGANGSGTSRIVEKMDIHNMTGADLTLPLTGMGYKPPREDLFPPPDYSGLNVTGTTTVFYQGNDATYSISAPGGPYPPVLVRPVVSFTGLNPLLGENFTIPSGAVMTMITELNVKPRITTICDLHPTICERPIPFNIFPGR